MEWAQFRPCAAHPISPAAKRRPITNSPAPSSERKAAPNDPTTSSMAKSPHDGAQYAAKPAPSLSGCRVVGVNAPPGLSDVARAQLRFSRRGTPPDRGARAGGGARGSRARSEQQPRWAAGERGSALEVALLANPQGGLSQGECSGFADENDSYRDLF